ncbi:MAG TPA: hypothetical protein VJU61_17745 [Polyangiaceae bacterium]|nr:hypothetical protein [Polyangiaceae bacterium]
MANPGMPPDLYEVLVDFEELDRLRAERRRAGQTVGREIGMGDAPLATAFDVIERHMDEGLTLTASACLAGVTRRTLAAWVKLADERRTPWAGWLDAMLCRNAEARRLVLNDLRKLATVDSRAFRDLATQLGRPSSLEYEIEGLRRSKTAALDVLVMPSDADRNQAGNAVGPPGGPDPLEGSLP